MSAPWELSSEHDLWEFVVLAIVVGAAFYIIAIYLWPSVYSIFTHFNFNYNFNLPKVKT